MQQVGLDALGVVRFRRHSDGLPVIYLSEGGWAAGEWHLEGAVTGASREWLLRNLGAGDGTRLRVGETGFRYLVHMVLVFVLIYFWEST